MKRLLDLIKSCYNFAIDLPSVYIPFTLDQVPILFYVGLLITQGAFVHPIGFIPFESHRYIVLNLQLTLYFKNTKATRRDCPLYKGDYL